jgi:hypothetical protein
MRRKRKRIALRNGQREMFARQRGKVHDVGFEELHALGQFHALGFVARGVQHALGQIGQRDRVARFRETQAVVARAAAQVHNRRAQVRWQVRFERRPRNFAEQFPARAAVNVVVPLSYAIMVIFVSFVGIAHVMPFPKTF